MIMLAKAKKHTQLSPLRLVDISEVSTVRRNAVMCSEHTCY